MSAGSEEVLRSLAALELEMMKRFKAINEKLDRVLVLAHAIERDVGKPGEQPKSNECK